MQISNGTIVRVKTLVDSSVRVELDFGEMGIPHMARLALAQRDGEQVTISLGGMDSETVPGRRTKRRTDKAVGERID